MKIAILFGGSYSLGWGRSQNMARALSAEGHDVWHIDQISPLHKTRSLTPSINQQPDKVTVVSGISALPYIRYPKLNRINTFFMKTQFNALIKTIEAVDVIIFYGVPQPWVQDYILENIPHAVALYDCADDKQETFSDLKDSTTGSAVHNWERALLEKVAGVSAINTKLMEKLVGKKSIASLVIPNGIDCTVFPTRPFTRPVQNERKLIFAGALNERLDIERITSLAHQEGVTIDFYGPHHPIVDTLSQHPSIHYKGYVSYTQISSVMKDYDIGLIAYRNLESIKNSSPLKILQYLSCGLPVVSFPIDAWKDMQQYITTIDSELPKNITLPEGRETLIDTNSWGHQMKNYTVWLKELITHA